MAKHPPNIGYVTGHATQKLSAVSMMHRFLMQYPIYRVISQFILNKRTVIGIPFLWMIFFFLIPFMLVLKISFSEAVLTQPPYTSLFTWLSEGVLELKINFQNYKLLWEDNLYFNAYLGSLKIAGLSTLMTLLVGFPIAYGISKAPKEWRFFLVMMVVLPFWTSFLIRVYAWVGILKPEGFLNGVLISLGIVNPDQPLQILNTPVAVYIGIVYSYLPFMILPLYANLEKMDHTLIEAALDLGCRPLKAFWVITLPMAKSGIVAGCFLVFIPALGEFVIPDILGGSDTLMIGKVLWDEFFINNDWPLSSSLAVILLLILIIPIMLFQRLQSKAA